jgi:hypothetical protein
MLSTVVAIIAAISLLLPGFLVAEIARSGRARASESDLELTLRSLFYALLIQLSFVWWTRVVADRVPKPVDWHRHLDVLVPYAAVVLLGVPVAVGVMLNLYLRRVESTAGNVRLHHRILGGRDARDPWDYVFQRLRNGAWLVIQLKGGEPGSPRLVGGKFGAHSAVGQSPTPHSLYLQELWGVGAAFPHDLVAPIKPQRGFLIPADQIDSIQILNPPGANVQSTNDAAEDRNSEE